MAGVLEHAVEHVLHTLPDGESVWLYDHAALDVAVLGEVGFDHDFVVPLGIILLAGGQLRHVVVFGTVFAFYWASRRENKPPPVLIP